MKGASRGITGKGRECTVEAEREDMEAPGQGTTPEKTVDEGTGRGSEDVRDMRRRDEGG